MPSPSHRLSTLAASALLIAPLPALADSIVGVCPDGSQFIVQSKESIPCARARLADDPSELPPLRPEMLPKPYMWYVDREERDPDNPYNLLERAQRMRQAREGIAAEDGADKPAPSATQRASVPAPTLEGPAPLALGDDELRDLVRLVALRQQVAPAEIEVSDIQGRGELRIQLARSDSFERRVAEATLDPANVVVFAAIAEREIEFQPNFFVVQGAATHRPDPADGREIGFLVGHSGTIPAGSLALGWFKIPQRFDPAQPLSIYWNDRSVDGVVLTP